MASKERMVRSHGSEDGRETGGSSPVPGGASQQRAPSCSGKTASCSRGVTPLLCISQGAPQQAPPDRCPRPSPKARAHIVTTDGVASATSGSKDGRPSTSQLPLEAPLRPRQPLPCLDLTPLGSFLTRAPAPPGPGRGSHPTPARLPSASSPSPGPRN